MPQYINFNGIEYVSIAVSTIYGTAKFNVQLPGIYAESYPHDFKGVTELVRDQLNIVMDKRNRERSIFESHGPMNVYHGDFQTVSFLPNIPYNKNDISNIINGLDRTALAVNGHVFKACVLRIESLSPWSHPLFKLASNDVEYNGEYVDDIHGIVMHVKHRRVVFQQEFPFVSLVVFGPYSLPITTEPCHNCLDHDWLIANAFEPATPKWNLENGPAVATMKNMRVYVYLNGRIRIKCKYDNTRKMELTVNNRNKRKQVGERNVVWPQIEKICKDLFAAFYLRVSVYPLLCIHV